MDTPSTTNTWNRSTMEKRNYRVEVKLRPEDYMALMRFCDRSTPGGRARMRRLYLMGGACYFIVAGFAFFDENHGVSDPGQFGIYLVSSALFVGALYYVFLAWLRPTMIRASLVRGSRRQLLAPTTLTFEEEQLVLENEHGRGTMSWRHLQDVAETEEYLFLVVGRINAIVLPKRCFESEDAREACIRFVKDKAAVTG